MVHTKPVVRRFDTIHYSLRFLDLAQYLMKGEMRQFGAPGTEGLTSVITLFILTGARIPLQKDGRLQRSARQSYEKETKRNLIKRRIRVS